MTESKLAFLDKLPIFAFLTQDELAALATDTREYEYDKGAVLAYQRDVADGLYIVRSGRLFARSVDEQGIIRHTKAYTEGDLFDDTWLFTPQSHPATIRATEPGRVLVIDSEAFRSFLLAHPQALEHLAPEYNEEGEHIAGLSPEAWEEAKKSRIAPERQRVNIGGDLPPDELIEYASRRSKWLLAFRVVPLLFVLVLLLIAFLWLRAGSELLARPFFSYGIPIVMTLGLGGFAFIQWLDWRNDYFVITSNHIIHYEYYLSPSRFGTVIKRTPVDQVQSVEIEKPNFLANLFDVGTARITTAAQSGVIYFDFIDDPVLVRDTLVRLQNRVRALDAGREQALMRESLENHFAAGPALVALSAETNNGPPQGPSFWARLRTNFRSRVVTGDVITYRKHLFVLLDTIRWPALVGSVLLLIAAFFLYIGLSLGPFWLLFAFFLLLDGGWFVWQVEDWRNDTYQVNNRYVIDIDRRPFGTGESRKQAELSNVQNISADRSGLLPTLFNYGNVYVETAGVSADITFEHVANPNQVQRDIFERREQFQRFLRTREGAQRRKEYAVLLDVYKQALEQERIPRRTPPTSEPPAQDGASNEQQSAE